MFSLRFWGVRGSIPCPGKNTLIFGGNTSCLELRAGNKLIIVDMGTGIKPLGDYLLANDLKNGSLDIDIFISHTHWDHIMGFPMFAPIFNPAVNIRIWGPISFDNNSLASIVGEQLSYKYWPVRLSELVARVEFRELNEGRIDLGGGLKVSCKYLNHSIACMGYSFEYMDRKIVSAFDHEPFRNLFSSEMSHNEFSSMEGEAAASDENKKMFDFYKNADILVHDAQFLPGEFENRIGWGHSSYDYAINAALAEKVKNLIFFHHDPNRSDKELGMLEKNYRKKTRKFRDLKITMAREGLKIEV